MCCRSGKCKARRTRVRRVVLQNFENNGYSCYSRLAMFDKIQHIGYLTSNLDDAVSWFERSFGAVNAGGGPLSPSYAVPQRRAQRLRALRTSRG